MLPVFLICWRNFNITRDCLESFIDTASEPLEISVAVPNDTMPGSGTNKIHQYLRNKVDKGIVKRALFYEENVIGHGLVRMIRDFFPDPDKHELFCLSDGDLVLPQGVDWVGLSRHYHEDHWVVTGCNLSTENYKPPCTGFSKNDDNFGLWLHVHKTKWFRDYHGFERNSIDSDIMTLARYSGGATKIREIEAYHCTWSIHDPESPYLDVEYSAYKKENASNWVFARRNENMAYELVTK